MARQITILHGWNDKPGSFRKLGRFLAANGYDVVNIWLGEWISTDDDVRIEDVARRMQVVIEELQQKGQLDARFDLIGHSTAGLATRDFLDPDGNGTGPYGLDRLWPFVITSNRGYRSLTRRLINEDGSDGTIRVPAANLNAGGITVDFSENAKIPRVHAWSSRTGGATIPFSVLPDRDHTQIKYPGDKTDAIAEVSARLGQMILQALACDSPAQYQSIAKSWLAASEETAALASDTERRRGLFRRNAPVEQEVHRYLQMITRVSDDQGEPVEDYYIDRDDLMKHFYRERTGDRQLAASIVIANPGRNARYFDKEVVGAEGHLLLHCDREPLLRELFRVGFSSG